MTKRIGIAAVFLVGCAVGGASSQLVVPRASAQQAATLTKWEYHFVSWKDPEGQLLIKRQMKAAADALGADGWELASDTSDAFWFKRPKM